MINELDNRIKQIDNISPIPENEKKLRDELQLLFMIADSIDEADDKKITDAVRFFAKDKLTKLENAKLLLINELQKNKYDLNELLLRIFKKLDKEGRRISFYAKTEKIFVFANERAMRVLFERLMCFSGNRLSVEIKKNRIKIKSDLSFSELNELRNNKSDLMVVINKILSFHSSTVFFSSVGQECEISISLNGMACNKTNKC